ncbi:MAG: OmpA family protein [Hydrogenimonas sp.]|nr:OmpA family protein [Hydrogenimonas sp.]
MKKVVSAAFICGTIISGGLNAQDCILVPDLNVEFKNDSTTYLNEGEKKEIEEFAKFLKKHNLYAVVEGHTSNSAPARYNYELSKMRAQKVADAIRKFGVKASHVRWMAYGESSPLYDNNSKDGYKNRRVVAEVFNSKDELDRYISSEKARIKDILFKEQ